MLRKLNFWVARLCVVLFGVLILTKGDTDWIAGFCMALNWLISEIQLKELRGE